jgi:hypothetical protein
MAINEVPAYILDKSGKHILNPEYGKAKEVKAKPAAKVKAEKPKITKKK